MARSPLSCLLNYPCMRINNDHMINLAGRVDCKITINPHEYRKSKQDRPN